MAQQLSPEFYRSYTRHATDDPRQREAASARRQRELLLRYQGGAATASAGCAASAAVPAVPSPRPPRRRPPSASSAAPPKPASGRRSKRGGDRGGEAAAEGPAHAAASSSRERERLLVELAAIRRDLEGRAPHERGGRRGGSGGRSRAGGEAALPAQLRSVLEGQIQLLEESNLELHEQLLLGAEGGGSRDGAAAGQGGDTPWARRMVTILQHERAQKAGLADERKLLRREVLAAAKDSRALAESVAREQERRRAAEHECSRLRGDLTAALHGRQLLHTVLADMRNLAVKHGLTPTELPAEPQFELLPHARGEPSRRGSRRGGECSDRSRRRDRPRKSSGRSDAELVPPSAPAAATRAAPVAAAAAAPAPPAPVPAAAVPTAPPAEGADLAHEFRLGVQIVSVAGLALVDGAMHVVVECAGQRQTTPEVACAAEMLWHGAPFLFAPGEADTEIRIRCVRRTGAGPETVVASVSVLLDDPPESSYALSPLGTVAVVIATVDDGDAAPVGPVQTLPVVEFAPPPAIESNHQELMSMPLPPPPPPLAEMPFSAADTGTTLPPPAHFTALPSEPPKPKPKPKPKPVLPA